MTYTKIQHMLSQWFLRNFRSDDTALSPKGRQRVWSHIVVPGAEGQNDIKDIPLPVSSVAICKDCFRLTDGQTDESFDIEHELSEYENNSDSNSLNYVVMQTYTFDNLVYNPANDDFEIVGLVPNDGPMYATSIIRFEKNKVPMEIGSACFMYTSG